MKINPHIKVLIAALIWGSSPAFVKYLDLPTSSISAFRLVIPTLILLVYLWQQEIKLFRGNMRIMILASFLNAIRMFFYFLAIKHTSLANATIILYTWPIFAALFGYIFLKERIKSSHALLMLLSFIGIIIVYSQNEISFNNNDFLGMSSMLLAAIVYASTFIIFKKESKNYNQYETVFYQNLIGAIIFLPFLFINEPFPALDQIGIAIFFAILIGLIGFSLFFSALKELKASVVSGISYMEVVSAIFFGIIFFHETLTWQILVGGSIIMVSTYLMKRLN